MNRTKRFSFTLLLALSILTSACGPILIGGPTPDNGPAFTQAAITIVAAMTQTAAVITPTAPPTETPVVPTKPPTDIPTAAPVFTDTPAPSATPEPSPTTAASPTATATHQANTLFEEDFSTPGSWFESDTDDWTFEFVDGKYRITNYIPGAVLWSIREVDREDVRLEVDAARTGGTESGFYGVTCRYVDEDNYYALVIASNGFYAIIRRADGNTEYRVTGTNTTAIKTGNAVNRLRADCIGTTLTLYANGTELVELTDDTFDKGWVGLVAGTRFEPGTEVTFDNFVVLAP